jgi:DNA gyrase/topoisomerase IV subunit B
MATTEQTIHFLSGIEHIRTRPGMYVSDTATPGVFINEVVDNALDELLNGYADRVEIHYNPTEDPGLTVADNGRGLPLTRVPDYNNQITAKLLFTELFSGGKFDNYNYQYSAGTNGVGLTVVNALSDAITVVVLNRDNGQQYALQTEKGHVVTESLSPLATSAWYSTRIHAVPSLAYFRSLSAEVDSISLQLAKQLRPHTTILLNDQEIAPFNFSGLLPDAVLEQRLLQVKYETDTFKVDLEFNWSAKEFNTFSRGAVNLKSCNEGFHINEVTKCLGRALQKHNDILNIADARLGLRIFVNTFAKKPVFTSQSKEKLSWIHELPGDFFQQLEKIILKKFSTEQKLISQLIQRLIEYKKRVESISERDFIHSVVRTGRSTKGVGIAIADCTTNKRDQAELFIVEGPSAGSFVRTTRDMQFQAVLALKGKPLNAAATNDIKVILSNEEMISLVDALGAGIRTTLDLKAARYGKILITCDADSDGAQISNLILGALLYLAPEFIQAGMVYEVLSPLYEQAGNYYYHLHELDHSKSFERFKGLGSMNADQVEHTIVNPHTRKLQQIYLDDAERALRILQSPSERQRIMYERGIIR